MPGRDALKALEGAGEVEFGGEAEALRGFLDAETVLEEEALRGFDLEAEDRAVGGFPDQAWVGVGERRFAHPYVARKVRHPQAGLGVGPHERLHACAQAVAPWRTPLSEDHPLAGARGLGIEEGGQKGAQPPVRAKMKPGATREDALPNLSQEFRDAPVRVSKVAKAGASDNDTKGAACDRVELKDDIRFVDLVAGLLPLVVTECRGVQGGDAARAHEGAPFSRALELASVVEAVEDPGILSGMGPAGGVEASEARVGLHEADARFARRPIDLSPNSHIIKELQVLP